MIKPWQGLAVFSLMSSLFIGAMPAHSWTSAQRTALVNSCIESNTNADAPDRSIVRSYCNCVVYAASRRYTVEQFSRNPQNALNELQRNGTLKRCGDHAMNTSTVWTPLHITGQQNACVNNLLQSGQTRLTRTQATNFCQCLVGELRARYTPAQTAQNPDRVLTELQRAGAMNRCRTRAGIS